MFNEDDVESPEQGLTWSQFYQTITSWLEEFYPLRTITITSRDPEFITPEIKYLLRRRNAVMRQSRNEVAAALISRIGSLIAKQNTRLLGHAHKQSGRH